MGPTPTEEIIPPHHYAPPPNFTVFLTHWGDIVHMICSVAKSRRTFWFFFEIKGLQHEIRASNFSSFKLRETVFILEIGFPVCSQNAQEFDVAASKRSFKYILTTIRFSRLVVIGGQPVLGFSSRAGFGYTFFV